MTDRTPPSHPERLLAHEPWLGALASRLVRDEDDARDLVQETMRRAIESPPREEHALRSFLGSIARHFAYDGTRRRKRRQQREQIAARAESQPSTLDLLARLDRQRDVQGEVLQLEEPFRETVLLRYYEELKPRQIAKRLGIPVATVKSRLRRGQERLRERMRERYGEKEWRAALAPLLTLPPTAFSTLATSVAVVLAFTATVVTGAWQWSAELRHSDTKQDQRRTAAVAIAAPELPLPPQVPFAAVEAHRSTSAVPSAVPATPRVAAPNAVRWPEDSLLWIDLERGLVRAPTQELCQISAELLASPEAVIDALAAGRSDVMFLPLSSGETPSLIADSAEALELHVLDAAGEPAHDLPVCVIWRGDGEQRVLWRGRTQHGAVRAPLLRSALERLMPRGEVLATFDFPLADVRACVLSGVQVAGDVPCLQAPPTGAVELALRDPWGAELPPGACAVLRARQPDGSTWEHALAWHAGSTRFGPIALGAEVEIEVRTLDLPAAVHRLPILHEAEPEPRFEIVAGAPSAQCSGRLLLVGGGELNHHVGLAELCDASGRILNRWRYEIEEDGAFRFALAARTDFDVAMVARLRLWVGSRLAEVPFAYPASGQILSLGEIGLEDVVCLARGRVMDERGLGVADAVVRIDRLQKIGGHGSQLWVPHLHARTEADGRFSLMGAYREQERFALEVEYPHAYGERRAIHPNQDGDLELLLRRGGTVEGALLLGAEIDLRSVAIVIYPSAGEHRVAALQADASFRFHGVPPGLTRIEVVSTEGESGPVASFAPCCVTADAVVSAGILDIADRVHRIERRVLDARGPFADQVIELRGTALDGAWVWRGRSDRDGCVRLLVPIEVETLDLFHEGTARVRFAAREALGWIDLTSGPR